MRTLWVSANWLSQAGGTCFGLGLVERGLFPLAAAKALKPVRNLVLRNFHFRSWLTKVPQDACARIAQLREVTSGEAVSRKKGRERRNARA